MGQNNTKEEWLSYSSKDFFQHQVELYRWRADPLVNTHICKVFFELKESVRDKENLKNLLQRRLNDSQHIPISQIMQLANYTESSSKEELMSFEAYVCTLEDLKQSLNLQELLYVMHAMFGGYETILAKLGRCSACLQSCFVTVQGQTRVWFNKDYKSNELQETKNEFEGKFLLINSEMTMIRKIIEICQKLASKHTQFLHFSRQFKSYMQRDILHNWTFSNARKLINSYVYTYKINLACNLKEVIKRKIKSNCEISEQYTSPMPSAQNLYNQTKSQLMSTGDAFLKNQLSTPHSKKENHRPASLSDYSHKKSDEESQLSIKFHSKKFSSTDLRSIQDRSKMFDSPKMSKSELVQNKHRDDVKFKSKDISLQVSQQVPTHRIKRDRQYAFSGDRDQSKICNYSTLQAFNPDLSNSQLQGQFDSRLENDKFKQKQNITSILKQNQTVKQKKKLQKKVATISKYISYYQNQPSSSPLNDISGSDLIEEVSQNTKSNKMSNQHKGHYPCNSELPPTFASPTSSIRVNFQSKNTQQQSIPFQKRTSFQIKQKNDQSELIQKGKSQYLRHHISSHHSQNDSSLPSSQPRMCFTVKTLNKLLGNNQVSVHQSNGSFMSLQQSQMSEYNGLLSKMGRSVDLQNIPSNRQILQRKPTATSNQLNRSINC